MSALAAELTIGRGTFRLEVSLRAESGITVVLGPSGAGKSTLLLTLLGAIHPERGRIALGDRVVFHDASGVDVPVRSRRMGIVFQDALLFPHLDAAANVAFGLDGADARRRAEGWLERVGAGALAARRPADLSGGERQRVALARALAPRPEALLLDEPFSALDPAARESIGALLVALQRESEVPFVHVTHDPAEALRLGDRAVALEAGRVAAEGTPADLLWGARERLAAFGSANWFRGIVVEDLPDGARVDVGGTTVVTPHLDREVGSTVVLTLPAEDVLLATGEIRGTSARNVFTGEILALHDDGRGIDVVVATPVPFRSRVTHAAAAELQLARGTRVGVLVKAAAFRSDGGPHS